MGLPRHCVLFFGGLFASTDLPRLVSGGVCLASHELDITLGTINTVVLITSSLTMALAAHGQPATAGS